MNGINGTSLASTQLTYNAELADRLQRNSNRTTMADTAELPSLQLPGSGSFRPMNSTLPRTQRVSTFGQMAGANSGMVKNYVGDGNTSLFAMNASRKKLGNRINALIQQAGIRLDQNEQITITVDEKDNIVIGGIKDKSKRDRIQKALENDPSLINEMRRFTVLGKLNEATDKLKAYEKIAGRAGSMGLENDPDDAFTNRGLRAYVIDQYLMENAGVGLDQLQVDRGENGITSLVGASDELLALFDNDDILASTVFNILENGEKPTKFAMSFDFANGAISDSSTKREADKLVKDLRDKIMGGVGGNGQIYDGIIDEARHYFEEAGVTPQDDEYKQIMHILSRGFAIQVRASGGYEIANVDGLDRRWVSVLEGIVEKALRPDPIQEADPTILIDIADTYLEQHRFEHGDVDDQEHMILIDFSKSTDTASVISPEADKAQDAINSQNAQAMGEAIREYLGENGIDAVGMEIEIDENGKITVSGDVDPMELRKAQTLIDQFVQLAQSSPATDGDDGGETAMEKMDIASERFDKDETKKQKLRDEAWEKSESYLSSNPAYSELYLRQRLVGWEAILPKNDETMAYFGCSKPVSAVQPNRFSWLDTNGGVGVALAGQNEPLANAIEYYHQLVDGMGLFHDSQKKSYSVSL